MRRFAIVLFLIPLRFLEAQDGFSRPWPWYLTNGQEPSTWIPRASRTKIDPNVLPILFPEKNLSTLVGRDEMESPLDRALQDRSPAWLVFRNQLPGYSVADTRTYLKKYFNDTVFLPVGDYFVYKSRYTKRSNIGTLSHPLLLYISKEFPTLDKITEVDELSKSNRFYFEVGGDVVDYFLETHQKYSRLNIFNARRAPSGGRKAMDRSSFVVGSEHDILEFVMDFVQVSNLKNPQIPHLLPVRDLETLRGLVVRKNDETDFSKRFGAYLSVPGALNLAQKSPAEWTLTLEPTSTMPANLQMEGTPIRMFAPFLDQNLETCRTRLSLFGQRVKLEIQIAK